MDEDQARDLVSSAISAGLDRVEHPLSMARIEDLSAEFLPLWEQQPAVAQTPGKLAAMLPLRYVIPDQDLKVLETCFSVLTTAAGAGFLIPQLGADPTKGLAAPITGIIVAVLKLAQNLRLAVRLQPLDYATVALLSKARADGLTIAALLEALRPSWPEVTAESIKTSLIAMTACATIAGTKAALVWKDDAGNWRANGI